MIVKYIVVARMIIATLGLTLLSGCHDDTHHETSNRSFNGLWRTDCVEIDDSQISQEINGYSNTTLDLSTNSFSFYQSLYEDSNCITPLDMTIATIDISGSLFRSPNHFHTQSGLAAYRITFVDDSSDVEYDDIIGINNGNLYLGKHFIGDAMARPTELDVSMPYRRISR